MDQLDGYILGNILAKAGSWKTKDGTSTVAAWNASNKQWRKTLSQPHNLAALLVESNDTISALARSVIKGDRGLVKLVLERTAASPLPYDKSWSSAAHDVIDEVASNSELLRTAAQIAAPKLLSVDDGDDGDDDDCNAIRAVADALRHFCDTRGVDAADMFYAGMWQAHNTASPQLVARLLLALLPKDADYYIEVVFAATVIAAGFGDAELVRAVFDAHFDVFLSKYRIVNVFDAAVEQGHVDTAMSVLEFPGVLDDADVCSSASVYLDEAIPSTPRGDAIVRRLYRAGAGLGWTPEANDDDNAFFDRLADGRPRVVLELAAEAGHEVIVRRIVEGGAWDADEERLCIGRAMGAAAARGHADIVGVLRERLATLALMSLNVHAAPFVPSQLRGSL